MTFEGTPEQIASLARSLYSWPEAAKAPLEIPIRSKADTAKPSRGSGHAPTNGKASTWAKPPDIEEIARFVDQNPKASVTAIIVHFTGKPIPTRIPGPEGKSVTNKAYNLWVHRIMQARRLLHLPTKMEPEPAHEAPIIN